MRTESWNHGVWRYSTPVLMEPSYMATPEKKKRSPVSRAPRAESRHSAGTVAFGLRLRRAFRHAAKSNDLPAWRAL